MEEIKDVLIVIPARGGSKGIPRKNLRSLYGKPLLYYIIEVLKSASESVDFVVSTDDDEIEVIAKRYGAEVIRRGDKESCDVATLDDVVRHALGIIEKEYKYIGTCQPTSPLLRPETIFRAVGMIKEGGVDSVISVFEDTHLTWRIENSTAKPNYTERVNRQLLPSTYKETGGIILSKASLLKDGDRIGHSVGLLPLNGGEAIDIDGYQDWAVAEFLLRRKKIVITLIGNSVFGTGHIHNSLIVANDLIAHDVIFVVDSDSGLAIEKIRALNYEVVVCEPDSLVKTILALTPDIVINDRLDTDEQYVRGLKVQGASIINFEDLGAGSRIADLVINAIYPDHLCSPSHYVGSEYYLLRDEFFDLGEYSVNPTVQKVLLSFGGSDPSNITEKVFEAVLPVCEKFNIKMTIVVGLGKSSFEGYDHPLLDVVENTSKISEYMFDSDIIFTSAGRTVYEVASIGVPAIVICQNEREITHDFASPRNGFANLGLSVSVSSEEISGLFLDYVNSFDVRVHASNLMRNSNIKAGRANVFRLINEKISELG